MRKDIDKAGQAWYFMEATEVIASVSPGYCLDAIEMLQYKFTISS